MQPRIIINLQEDEYKALLNVAVQEYRPLRLQAELIFRDALIKRGIIENPKSEPHREREGVQHVEAPN